MISYLFMLLEFFIFIFLAGFFSCTETAITAITKAEYNKIKKSIKRKDKFLVHLIDEKEKIVSSTLIATNFLNMLISSITTAFTVETLGIFYLPITTGLATIFIIIFAEIIPKTLATHYAFSITKKSAFLLYLSYLLNYPLVLSFSFFSKGIVKFIRLFYKEKKETFSEDQLKELINISREDGALLNFEHALLKKAIHLKNLKVKHIMTKLSKIVYIKEDISFQELIKVFKDSNFSRLPIFSKDEKGVLGLIHYKDVLFNFKKDLSISSIMRAPIFVPESSNVFFTIKIMNKEKRNMVFVIDEDGDVLGLITMDDIVSIVCGKVEDEYKHETIAKKEEKLTYLENGEIRASSNISITALNEALGSHFKSEYYDSLSGFILECFQYLPKEGEVITLENVSFKIESIKGSKIESVIIKKI